MNIAISNTLVDSIQYLNQLGIKTIDINKADSMYDINNELDYILLDGHWSFDRLSTFLEEARELNLITMFVHMPEQNLAQSMDLFQEIDILCCKKEEMSLEIEELLEKGIKMLAINFGEEGVLYATQRNKKLLNLPGLEGTTGSKEVEGIISGLFYGLSKEYDMEKALYCGIIAKEIVSQENYSENFKGQYIEDILRNQVKT